jgi:hypothetical protein
MHHLKLEFSEIYYKDIIYKCQEEKGAVQKSPPTLCLQAQAVHPSLRSGRRSPSLRSGRRPQGETPRLTPQGDSRRACTKTFFSTASGVK